MKKIIRTLTKNEVSMLRALIGKRLISYKRESDFEGHPPLYVQLTFASSSIFLECFDLGDDSVSDCYYANRFVVAEGEYEFFSNAVEITSVDKSINDVSIVTYNICYLDEEDNTVSYTFFHAFILHFEDGSRLSFEQYTENFEYIIIGDGKLITVEEYIKDSYGDDVRILSADVEFCNL